jgi:hypothetical protein
MGFAGALDWNSRRVELTSNNQTVIVSRALSAYLDFNWFSNTPKKSEEKIGFLVYFRLRSTRTAAATTIITMTAAMAMNVVVGIPLVGG